MRFCEAVAAEAESIPDLFSRRTYRPVLDKIRGRLAKLIRADQDEVVLVPNASHGLNTVLKNFIWKENDLLIESKWLSILLVSNN